MADKPTGGLTTAQIVAAYETDEFGNPVLDASNNPVLRAGAAAPEPAEPTTGPAQAARAQHGPKPTDDVAWGHQPGCTNPVSDDWDCACGPEVIPD